MFERFTDRARRAVVLAQEHARGLNHDYIGTEHLLLGLIAEEQGVAAQILAALGLDVDRVEREIDARVGKGTTAPKGHMPFTPRAKKVLELSLRQALKLDHDYIGTEHILLGLVDEGQGVAAQIMLATVDGGLERIEADVTARLVELGLPHRFRAETRERMSSQGAADVGSEDDVVKRLEAIEARLGAIERLLRDERGDQTG